MLRTVLEQYREIESRVGNKARPHGPVVPWVVPGGNPFNVHRAGHVSASRQGSRHRCSYHKRVPGVGHYIPYLPHYSAADRLGNGELAAILNVGQPRIECIGNHHAGRRVGAGVYFAELRVGTTRYVEKLTVVR